MDKNYKTKWFEKRSDWKDHLDQHYKEHKTMTHKHKAKKDIVIAHSAHGKVVGAFNRKTKRGIVKTPTILEAIQAILFESNSKAHGTIINSNGSVDHKMRTEHPNTVDDVRRSGEQGRVNNLYRRPKFVAKKKTPPKKIVPKKT